MLFESGPEGGRLEFRARGHGYGQHAITGPVQYVQVEFAVGETTYSGRFVSPPAEVVSNDTHRVELRGDGISIPVQQVGHEAIEIVDFSGFPFDIELVVWFSEEITTEEYDALPLPPGWNRNEPREGVGQRGRFLRSPGREADGEFTYRDMFGFTWLHNATVVSLNGPADPGGLLSSNTVEKHHELSWCPGSTITTLTSPEGLEYILVSRDSRRTSDTPTIPSGWALEERVLDEELQVLLPTRTINLRADNEDSFQGPLSREVDIAVLPWRLRAEAGAPVHVAVFGSQDVDVEAVDIASVAFGPAGAMGTSADVEVRHLNDDDRVDLSLTFDYEDTGIPLGESEACLTGEMAGAPFEGCTRVMACGHGFELAFILPPLLCARRGLRGRDRPASA